MLPALGLGHAMRNWSALHEAAENGNVQVARVLLQNDDVDINGREPVAGYTPLHEAAEHHHLEMCALLFRSGAYINARTHPQGHSDGDGKTALQLAREPFRSKMLEVLLPQRLP